MKHRLGLFGGPWWRRGESIMSTLYALRSAPTIYRRAPAEASALARRGRFAKSPRAGALDCCGVPVPLHKPRHFRCLESADTKAMPESRRRKPKPKKPDPLPTRPKPQPPQRPQRTAWEKIRDHPLVWFLALIASLLAIGEPVHQALLEPEISASGEPDVSHPFSAPFNIVNRSWLFDMKDAQLHCGISRIVTTGHWAVMGFDILSRPATIEADTPAAFRCLIGPGTTSSMAPPGDIESAHMFLFRLRHSHRPSTLPSLAICYAPASSVADA